MAGANGLRFAANYHVSPATVLEAVEGYRAAFRPSADLDRPYVSVSADVVVAGDEATARELAAGYGPWVRSIRSGEGAIQFPTPAQAREHAWTDAVRLSSSSSHEPAAGPPRPGHGQACAGAGPASTIASSPGAWPEAASPAANRAPVSDPTRSPGRRPGEQAGDLVRGELGVGGGVGYGVHAVPVGGDAPAEALVVRGLLTAAGDDDKRAAHGDALGLGQVRSGTCCSADSHRAPALLPASTRATPSSPEWACTQVGIYRYLRSARSSDLLVSSGRRQRLAGRPAPAG